MEGKTGPNNANSVCNWAHKGELVTEIFGLDGDKPCWALEHTQNKF